MKSFYFESHNTQGVITVGLDYTIIQRKFLYVGYLGETIADLDSLYIPHRLPNVEMLLLEGEKLK